MAPFACRWLMVSSQKVSHLYATLFVLNSLYVTSIFPLFSICLFSSTYMLPPYLVSMRVRILHHAISDCFEVSIHDPEHLRYLPQRDPPRLLVPGDCHIIPPDYNRDPVLLPAIAIVKDHIGGCGILIKLKGWESSCMIIFPMLIKWLKTS